MFVFPSVPATDVLVLGAGFSKALSSNMPLTDELGNEVLQLVQARSSFTVDKHFDTGGFEAWLSRLADEQPDLTTAENLANRALFELCSEALAEVLDDRVRVAAGEALSRSWLPGLLGTLHIREATVVTFNQDVLMESAVEAGDLHSWDRQRWPAPGSTQPAVRWWDILDDQPRLPGMRWSTGPPQATFRLLKLHGSTNWSWCPGDLSGATTARWFLPGTVPAQEAVPDEASARRRELPGRVPLIVPPAAAKSSYYRVPLLVQLWRDARAALSREQVRVSLVGYSIPPTDLVTSGMLRETLVGRSDDWTAPIDVVNPTPGPVWDHLAALGVQPHQMTTTDSVEEFAAQYQSRAANEFVSALRAWKPNETDCLLLVGSSLASGRKVIAIHDRRDKIELVLEKNDPPYTGTNIAPEGGPAPLSLQTLLEHLTRSSAENLVTVTPSGRRRAILGAEKHVTNLGAGNGRWQVLITAEPAC